jgi:AraC-like DNA-binding protein
MTWKGETKTLDAGTAVLIDCTEYQEYHTVPPEPWRFRWAHFKGDLRGYVPTLMDRLTPVRIVNGPAFEQEWNELSRSLTANGLIDHARQNLRLSALLVRMLSDALSPVAQPSTNDCVQQTLDYIRDHIAEPLAVQDIAAEIGISKYWLIRSFRQRMAVTPYQYIISTRIGMAQHLLRSTDQPVFLIAGQVGYADMANFTRQFRKSTGLSPSVYRAKNIRIRDIGM